jgi:cation:H+ antiporter
VDLVLSLAAIAGGLVLLVLGADGLVRGASRLAAAAGISAVVIGLTVVAFGTSAPELAVSVGSALSGAGEVALGNAIGSNIFNVLAVLGAAALFGRLVVHQRIVRIDVPLLVAVTAAVWRLAADGVVGAVEGAVLVVGLVGYTLFSYLQSRREPADVVAEYDEAFGDDSVAARDGWARSLGLLVAGLAGLVVGSQLLVGGATRLAADLGIPDIVVGLTVVAAGTSLPELVTSVVAVRRGELDIAVGNVVGSNLFNLLGVLGLASLVGGGLEVPRSVVTGDLPTTLVTTLVALPVLATGLAVERWEGTLLLGGYAGYVAVLVLVGLGSPVAGTAQTVLVVALLAVASLLVLAAVVARVRTRRVTRR